MDFFLGIDTSNYTTSAALYDVERGNIIEKRALLPVREGSLGLRQSEAVFAHVKTLGGLIETLFCGFEGRLRAVGVSGTPTDEPGSYMPCFLPGVMAAKTVAASHGIPLHTFSHQAGHIAAALFSSGRTDYFTQPFLAFHISGGTTEGLMVCPGKDRVIDIFCVCKALDLHAGQLVDRVGATLGLPFPSGPALEKLATLSGKAFNPKVAVREKGVCLSGAENQCADRLARGEPPEDVARYCLDFIAFSVCEMIAAALCAYPGLPIVCAGGVMSNSIIRSTVSEHFTCDFAQPRFSSDNAAGTAVLAGLASKTAL